MIALDTETTGLDLRHGAKPFLVTISNGEENIWWEWDVDPLTREPTIPQKDKRAICREIVKSDKVVFQNAKFDILALETIGIEWEWWDKIYDTQLAGHLLNSFGSCSLERLALNYLGFDMTRVEKECQEICQQARTWARREYPDWRIAKKGLPEMPSAKEKVWKFDMWLPRAVALANGEDDDCPWFYSTSNYANLDSEITYFLHEAMLELVQQRGLMAHYQERLKLPRIIHHVESAGVTLSATRRQKIVEEYQEESQRLGRVCVNLAKRFGADLDLPKSGNNKSLLSTVYKHMKLPVFKRSKKTGEPSLDKQVLDQLLAELKPGSPERTFLWALRNKRKRDTACNYLESYKKFWIPIDENRIWYRLFPSLNPTGTDTLRWSSSNPNEQNISKQEGFNLRYVFGPLPGREWYSLDAKNLELRIPAYEANEIEMIKLFEKPDEPPYYGSVHLLNFSTVYPDIWEKELQEVGLEQVGPHCKKKYASTCYQWCKNGGFAHQYGSVEREDGWGTANRAFHKRWAQSLLKERFTQIARLNQDCIRYAQKHGHVHTMPDHTVDPNIGYPLVIETNQRGEVKPTTPLNYHVQGTACWWMMKAMIRVMDLLDVVNKDRPLRHRVNMVMQVHDELVFDMPKSTQNRRLLTGIKERMEEGGNDIGVPTPVSVEYHPNNWAEGELL